MFLQESKKEISYFDDILQHAILLGTLIKTGNVTEIAGYRERNKRVEDISEHQRKTRGYRVSETVHVKQLRCYNVSTHCINHSLFGQIHLHI